MSVHINPHAPAVAREETTLDAAPERVWAVLTDIDRWPDWHPGVSRASLEGPLAPGSTFRWRASGANVLSTLCEVDPPHRISWEGKAAGTRAVHIWALRTQGAQTVVHTEESFRGMAARLLRRTMQRSLEKALRDGLASLKNTAETV